MKFLACVLLCFVNLLGLPSLWAQSPSPSEETAVRAVVEKYFTVYANRDLDGLMRLWSAKSPEREARRKSTAELFASSEKITLKSFAVRRASVTGASARVRVEADLEVIEAKTGKEMSGFGKLLRTVEYVKEAGAWKIQREGSTYDELAAALAAAKSEPERTALLAQMQAEEPELITTAELVRALGRQGDDFFDQAEYARAASLHRLAQGIAERIGDQPGIARSLYNLGNVAWAQSNLAQAMEYIQKSQSLYERLGNKPGIARALNSLGNIQYAQGNYAQALEHFRQSLTLLESVNNKPGVAIALNNIGNIHFRQDNYTQALEHFQKSLALSEALGDQAGIARTLTNIGNVYSQQGDNTLALEHYQKSLTLQETLGNKVEIANVIHNIGIVYYDQSNYARALEYYQKSLTLDEAIGNQVGVAFDLNDIGNIYLSQGNDAQALEYYRKGLALSEKLGNKEGMAVTLDNIGHVCNSQGNYAQALEYLQKSLALRETMGGQGGIARTLKNIGNIHYNQSDYAQALAYFQKSLALREALGNKNGIAVSLSNVAKVHQKQGRHAQALDFAERAATLARQIGETEVLWRARLMSGTVYRALHQPASARLALEEAIVTVETLRTSVAGGEENQQRFFATRIAPYHAMMDSLHAEGNALEALRLAERAKSRVLLDVLQHGRVNITKALTTQEQKQEQKLRTELSALNLQLNRTRQANKPDAAKLDELQAHHEKARLNYEAFQTTLYAAHPELKTQRGEAPSIRAEELTPLLPDAASALLEFVVTEERTYLFVVTKGTANTDVQAFALSLKREELAQQIEAFRQQLAGRDLSFRASAAQLYDLLLKPAQAQLKGKTNLIIVPDDKLWELPFQALRTNANRFLLEDAAISYAPSLTVLREMTKRRRANVQAGATLLALGNPALGAKTIERAALMLRDGKLAPLPTAEQEVKTLGQLYPRNKIYIGSEAREDRVKAEAAPMRILHFATHGVLNNASPMYSHLVLAHSEKDDGLLEAWELMQMDLQADLAVLSACETARGRFGAGEGMIGLSWALFVAGVPSTVVSQWKVESASTRDLMLQFHRGLQSGKANKAEALRQAALSLLKQPATSHPFYWAGFVLVGDQR